MANDKDTLTPEELDELDEHNGEPLPDREAMSILPVSIGDEAFAILPVEPPSGNETLPVEPRN